MLYNAVTWPFRDLGMFTTLSSGCECKWTYSSLGGFIYNRSWSSSGTSVNVALAEFWFKKCDSMYDIQDIFNNLFERGQRLWQADVGVVFPLLLDAKNLRWLNFQDKYCCRICTQKKEVSKVFDSFTILQSLWWN